MKTLNADNPETGSPDPADKVAKINLTAIREQHGIANMRSL